MFECTSQKVGEPHVPTQLPSSWKVTLGERTEAASGRLVDLAAQRRGRSLAVAFLDGGVETFGLTYPIGPAVIVLPAFPGLDDVWTLYMIASCERDVAMRQSHPKSWEVISHYAEQVRQGFVPERVAAERSVQAVLRSISTVTLPKEPQAFIDEALRLCELVAQKVSAGARLLDDDLVGEEPRLQRHLAFLQEDARVYREDVQRGRRYSCDVPARDNEPARSLPLLVLPQPKSQMFKLWARRDSTSSDGNGYALLLVSHSTGEILLSSDPARRLPIGWLASPLDRSPGAKRSGSAMSTGCHSPAMPRSGSASFRQPVSVTVTSSAVAHTNSAARRGWAFSSVRRKAGFTRCWSGAGRRTDAALGLRTSQVWFQ
jgi:hypothetical protein